MIGDNLNRSKANELAESIKKLQSLHAQISELIMGLNKSVLKISVNIKDYAYEDVMDVRYGYKKDLEKREYLNNLSNDYYDVKTLLVSTSTDINKIASKFDEVSIKFSRASKKILELNNSEAYDWINFEKYEAED